MINSLPFRLLLIRTDGTASVIVTRVCLMIFPLSRDPLFRTLRQDQRVREEGMRLVRKSGSLAKCRKEARGMADLAWRDFSRKVPPSKPKVMLRLFTQNLLDHTGSGYPEG